MSGILRSQRAFASAAAFFVVAFGSFLSPCFAAMTAEPASEPVTAQAASSPLLEPSTLLLVGLGLVGLAVYRARYRDQK